MQQALNDILIWISLGVLFFCVRNYVFTPGTNLAIILLAAV